MSNAKYRDRLVQALRELESKLGKLEHPRAYDNSYQQVGRRRYVQIGADLSSHLVLSREIERVQARLAVTPAPGKPGSSRRLSPEEADAFARVARGGLR